MPDPLTDADREHLTANLRASARWLGLLSTRLKEGGEYEAARLAERARADIGKVCQRLSRARAR